MITFVPVPASITKFNTLNKYNAPCEQHADLSTCHITRWRHFLLGAVLPNAGRNKIGVLVSGQSPCVHLEWRRHWNDFSAFFAGASECLEQTKEENLVHVGHFHASNQGCTRSVMWEKPNNKGNNQAGVGWIRKMRITAWLGWGGVNWTFFFSGIRTCVFDVSASDFLHEMCLLWSYSKVRF